MKKIKSFTVDHTKLKRGIYVSRKDSVGEGVVTTFDIRLKRPNKELVIEPAAMHTMEHIGATFLRNHPHYEHEVIYFGPMGCLTGFYLLLGNDYEASDIVSLVQELFSFIAAFEDEIPGASPIECGNYTLMDLSTAKLEAERYYEEVLKNISEERTTYPE